MSSVAKQDAVTIVSILQDNCKIQNYVKYDKQFLIQNIANGNIEMLLNDENYKDYVSNNDWKNAALLIENALYKDFIIEEVENEPEVISGSHRCKRCGSNKILVSELQLRSADEGATTIFQCYFCHLRFQ